MRSNLGLEMINDGVEEIGDDYEQGLGSKRSLYDSLNMKFAMKITEENMTFKSK